MYGPNDVKSEKLPAVPDAVPDAVPMVPESELYVVVLFKIVESLCVIVTLTKSTSFNGSLIAKGIIEGSV